MNTHAVEAIQNEDRLLFRLGEAVAESLVGGKAHTLGRLMGKGVPVPPGLVVTDRAFQRFLDENDLREAIDKETRCIKAVGAEAIRAGAEAIRSLLQAAELPADLRRQLALALDGEAEGSAIIVRSSAVGEDSRGHSFAGQLDSFPDLSGRAQVQGAILRCWASRWSERTLHYQLASGSLLGGMGVVVQQQVEPAVAGVLFTRSPTANPGGVQMIGEYCFGHGEELMSGRINPGRFALGRDRFDYSMVAEPEQPPVAPAISSLLVNCLPALRELGLDLEAELGGPQDIEWVIDAEGTLHVVQSRPITAATPAAPALAPVAGPRSKEATHIWSNANINENYPGPVSPFLYSVARDSYYHYFRNLAFALGIGKGRIARMEESFRGIVGAHGGHLYYNLTHVHDVLRLAPLGEHLVGSFNIFVGATERSKAHRGEASPWRGLAGSAVRLGTEVPGTLRVAVMTLWRLRGLERGVEAFAREVDAFASRNHPKHLRAMGLPQLRAALRGWLDIRFHRWLGASLADAAAMVGYGLLKHLASGAGGEDGNARHNALLQGLPNLASARPVSELWELSRTVRGDRALLELFRGTAPGELWERLQAPEEFPRFRRRLDAYLEDWGFRCSGELMLTVKSFQEDPTALLTLLKGYALLEGESPPQALEAQEKRRLAETALFLESIAARKLLGIFPRPGAVAVARRVLALTQRAITLRERARLKQSLLYSRCRMLLLRIGEELVASGTLSAVDDVFFLTHRELEELLAGYSIHPRCLGKVVAARKEEQEGFGDCIPPETLILPVGGYGLPATAHPGRDAGAEVTAPGTLKGTGACGGKKAGRAVVLRDVTEADRLAVGDILVTKQTDPGWAPVFFLVGGLVMERGGMLSHGAIIAREYGIPTVVGVPGATLSIATGDTLEVDGDTGTVRILA